MNRLLLACVFTLSLPYFTFSQHLQCGQHIVEEQLRDSDPAINQAFEDLDAWIREVDAAGHAQSGRAEQLIIPVVFHVIHLNGPEKISKEQIKDCIRIVNEDYNKENLDLSEVVPAFTPVIGDAEITFRLAKKDPSGNPTDGIEYIESAETNVGDDGSKLNPWPRNKYLNIWVSNVIGVPNAAAYAYRPTAGPIPPNVDGIIANHRYVGSIGTASPSRSRTMSHEIGHYLGLPHTWGPTNDPGESSNCSMDDGIGDTPNTIGSSGCNTNQATCGSLDNIQNFMDYASCDRMFTAGQINVMRAVLNSSSSQRNQLTTASNLASTGVSELSVANFSADFPNACAGQSIKFMDQSEYGPSAWSWEITGPENFSSFDQNPEFTFTKPGSYDVKLTVAQSGSSLSVEKEGYILVSEGYGVPMPFTEGFEDATAVESRWRIDDYRQDGITWELSDEAAASGQYAMRVKALGVEDNSADELTLVAGDMRQMETLSISFKSAYAQRNALSDDELALYVSGDCGESWVQAWARSGANLAGGTANVQGTPFVPSASDWKSNSVSSLPLSWVGENMLLKFVFTNKFGNTMWLDDINIFGQLSNVPALRYPADGQTEVNENTALDWLACGGIDKYEYEYDLSPDFNTGNRVFGSLDYIGESSDNTDTEVRTNSLQRNQLYFWRVRAVTGTTPGPWSETWSFRVAGDGVGIADAEEQNQIKVYPNPAKEYIDVVWPTLPASDHRVELFDATGRLVYQINNPRTSNVRKVRVNAEHLSDGWYMLVVTSEEGAFHTKVSVAH